MSFSGGGHPHYSGRTGFDQDGNRQASTQCHGRWVPLKSANMYQFSLSTHLFVLRLTWLFEVYCCQNGPAMESKDEVTFIERHLYCSRTSRATAIVRGQARHKWEPVVLHSNTQRLGGGCLVDKLVEDIAYLGGVSNWRCQYQKVSYIENGTKEKTMRTSKRPRCRRRIGK